MITLLTSLLRPISLRPHSEILTAAVFDGNVRVVSEVLEMQPELLEESLDFEDDTALNIAACYGQLKVVQFLVTKYRADVESRGFQGRTPFLQAAANGHFLVVKFLIEEAKADIEARDAAWLGDMAIHLAAYFGHVSVVAYLLSKRPDMLRDARNKNNNTALCRAAFNGKLNVVEFLVKEKGADVETRGFQGRTPLMQASQNGHLAVIKFLVEEAGADVDAKDESENEDTAIHSASFFGHVDVVAYLLQKRPDLLEGAVNKFKNTALCRAAFNGQLNVVEFLVLEKKANVEAKSFKGRTPLMQAAVQGHLLVVNFLVEEGGADVLAKDSSETEDMAIHLAAFFGHSEVVAYLLQKFPEMLEHARTKTGDTVLSIACYSGQLNVVAFLVKHKQADVETKGLQGRTPLIQAAEKGHLPVIRFLVEEAGADIWARDTGNNEDTAIHLAAFFGHVDVVAYLTSRNEDLVHAINKIGITPLSYAKQQKHRQIANFLRSKGACC